MRAAASFRWLTWLSSRAPSPRRARSARAKGSSSGTRCGACRCRWPSTIARSSTTRCAGSAARWAIHRSPSSCCLLSSRSPSSSRSTRRCSVFRSIAATSGARSWTAASSNRPARSATCAESAPTSSVSASSRSGCARNQMVSSKPERSSLRSRELDDLVAAALREDLGRELGGADITTKYVVDADLMGEARIIAKKGGVLSGADAAARVFEKVDPPCDYVAVEPDGTQLEPGDEVAKVIGPLASILTAERTALNFLQRLSGIATVTRRYADALAGYPAVTLLDTRKTTPGLRFLERAAVRAGGGHNHRDGLWDAILIKDNHVAAAGGVTEAIERARNARMPVEVEVDTLEQLDEALAAGAELILLDNMNSELMRRAVEMTAGRARLEASGGMTFEGAVESARAGADRISVGALTHSAPALDLRLDLTKTWRWKLSTSKKDRPGQPAARYLAL